jgi:hypothetical protein
MISATLLGIFFVPVFFALVRRPWRRRKPTPVAQQP